MVVAVDHIADVVHKPGDAGQLGILRTVPQLCQNSGGGLGAAGHMGKAVLREAPGQQGTVRLRDVGAYLRILTYVFISDVHGERLLFQIGSVTRP